MASGPAEAVLGPCVVVATGGWLPSLAVQAERAGPVRPEVQCNSEVF